MYEINAKIVKIFSILLLLTLLHRKILNISGRTSEINCELYSSEQTCRKSCNNRSTIESKRSSCAFDNTCIQQCSVHGTPKFRSSIAISIHIVVVVVVVKEKIIYSLALNNNKKKLRVQNLPKLWFSAL